MSRMRAWGRAQSRLGPTGPGRLVVGGLAVLACLALLWLMYHTVGESRRRDETWLRIQRQGVLRVGMDASYPPFEVVDGEGRFDGFDVDLAKALAARWGVEVQFVNVHFDGLYDALQTGKFDLIISALPYDRTMTRDVLYSQSYFNAGQVLLTKADDLSIASFDDLQDKRVAVELGAEAHQLARRLARDRDIDVEIVPVRETAEVLTLLEQGAADAILCDKVTALTYMGRGPDLRLAGPDLTSDPYVVAAPRDAPALIDEVNQALREWQQSGFLEERERYWFWEVRGADVR